MEFPAIYKLMSVQFSGNDGDMPDYVQFSMTDDINDIGANHEIVQYTMQKNENGNYFLSFNAGANLNLGGGFQYVVAELSPEQFEKYYNLLKSNAPITATLKNIDPVTKYFKEFKDDSNFRSNTNYNVGGIKRSTELSNFIQYLTGDNLKIIKDQATHEGKMFDILSKILSEKISLEDGIPNREVILTPEDFKNIDLSELPDTRYFDRQSKRFDRNYNKFKEDAEKLYEESDANIFNFNPYLGNYEEFNGNNFEYVNPNAVFSGEINPETKKTRG
jgi:hypothetical protein